MTRGAYLALHLVPAVFLVGAIGPWPYGYFTLLRFVVCIAALWLAYLDYQREEKVHLRTQARVEQDGAIVAGDSIDYFIAEELVKADSNGAEEGNRVQVVIPPSATQEVSVPPTTPALSAAASAATDTDTDTDTSADTTTTEQEEDTSVAPQSQ